MIRKKIFRRYNFTNLNIIEAIPKVGILKSGKFWVSDNASKIKIEESGHEP